MSVLHPHFHPSLNHQLIILFTYILLLVATKPMNKLSTKSLPMVKDLGYVIHSNTRPRAPWASSVDTTPTISYLVRIFQFKWKVGEIRILDPLSCWLLHICQKKLTQPKA